MTSPAGVGACQRYVVPGAGTLARAREQAVRQLAAQLALLARQERELRAALDRAVRTRFAPLTEIVGVGTVVAAGLIAEMGAPRPGFGDAQLAAMAGVAPLEASSAGGVRHRLNRHGNRRLNRLVHQVAVVQARCYAPARAYLERRRHEGRTARESRRALKRYLIRRIWRQWHACWLPATPTAGVPQLAA